MAKRLLTRSSLATIAVVLGLFSSSDRASAERYLFDILFGNRNTQTSEQPAAKPEPRTQTAQRRRVKVPKISSPSYYTYHAPKLVPVDFGAISSALEGEGDTASSPFHEALAAADGFELSAHKKIAEAIVKHYSENPGFVWVEEGAPSEKAKAVLQVLGNAAAYGLTDADYVVHKPTPAFGAEKTPEALKQDLLRFEMSLSARVLRYARDVNLGRVDPNKLSGYHDFPAKPIEEARVLSVLANTPKPAPYLEALHPQNNAYASLVEELKRLRNSPARKITVAPDTFVRPGGSHPEFSKILQIIDRDADADFREQHGGLLKAHMGSESYAPDLVPLIKAAQKQHDLNPDGIVGRQTVAALAGDPREMRIEKVLMALERLRWLPSRLGDTHVMINAAGFKASYIEDGREKLSMRAVVGTPSNQTSFFYDEIEYVEYNPYWGVPQSIIVNEMLPKLRRNPSYLDRAGYEVTDSRGRRVSSASVNWWGYGRNIPFNVRQKPGKSNALGELKIMFPNSHAIYMHDTPQKHLFRRDTRAYSHGCVRLEEPRAMAAAVLGSSVDHVGSMVARGGNQRENLKTKIPVYVSYFTAWPDTSGEVSYHYDVYDRDDSLKRALAKVEEQRAPGS